MSEVFQDGNWDHASSTFQEPSVTENSQDVLFQVAGGNCDDRPWASH